MADPIDFDTRIETAREAFAELLSNDAYFSDIPVLTERKGDVAAAIQQALAKLGICAVVVAASADKLQLKGTALQLRVKFVAQISEKPLLNKTGKPANRAVIHALKAIHRKPNGLDGAGATHRAGINEFDLQEDQPFELLSTQADVVYQVAAHTWVDV